MEETSYSSPQRAERIANFKEKSGNSKKIIIIVAIIVVVALIVFGTTKFLGSKKENAVTPTPTPTEQPTPTSEPTPTAEPSGTPTPKPTNTPTPKPTVNPIDKSSGLDRSKLSIHVLNGNGTAGVSKIASDYLEGLGYNVIQIGNAQNFDYQKTVIQIKNDKSDFLSLLSKDLSSKYSVGTTSADLASSERPDAYVIIGK